MDLVIGPGHGPWRTHHHFIARKVIDKFEVSLQHVACNAKDRLRVRVRREHVRIRESLSHGHRRNGNHDLDVRIPLLQRLQRRSEEHTSELQSLMRISYAVFCLKKKTKSIHNNTT